MPWTVVLDVDAADMNASQRDVTLYHSGSQPSQEQSRTARARTPSLMNEKVLFLTVHDDRDNVQAAFSVGASGYDAQASTCFRLSWRYLHGGTFVVPFDGHWWRQALTLHSAHRVLSFNYFHTMVSLRMVGGGARDQEHQPFRNTLRLKPISDVRLPCRRVLWLVYRHYPVRED